MITFARKPGLNAYWIAEHRYTVLAGRHPVLENLDITGPGRFQSADLVSLWDMPFIKVFKDGNAWCALVGDNLQDGTAEFADHIEGKDVFDQITDHGIEYQRAHPEAKCRDKFFYWEPLDIEIMAKQSRGQLPRPRQ